jgi:ribosomal-protein-alanine N-acetyltransferase
MSATAFPWTFPHLETKRLILREITPGDREAIFRNFSDPEVTQWFFEEPYTQIEQAEEIIEAFRQEFEQGKGLTWALVLKDNDELVGTCGYAELELGSWGEIGFDLAKDHWRKGLMTEALRAAVEYGFAVLQLDKIELHTYSTNVRAIGLARKLGFALEAVRDDTHYFVLLAPE